MMKSLASAALLGLLITGTALAQSTPQPDPQQPQATQPAAQPTETTVPAAPVPGTAAAPARTSTEAPTATEAPSTAEGCIAAAADLGTAAEGKMFPDEKLDQLDRLFSKLETLCDGKQFAEAMTVAKDIKTMLDGQ